MNQSLKQYLRHYINNAQSNWVKLLFMAQLTLNVKVSNTTKVTSFFANFEKKSNLFEKSTNQVSTKATISKGDTIKMIQKNILKMQENSTKYQNKRRKMTPLLKEGDKVYLLTRNLKLNKRRSKKLNHIKVESFFIKRIKGQINYELNLLIDVKIFFVFHISMLELAHSNTPIQITFRYKSQEDQEYEVKQILRQKGQQYLVKWKDYPTSKNTWESRENLTNCVKKLKKFQKRGQEMWGINHLKYSTKPLASTRRQWWVLEVRGYVPSNPTLLCFAIRHPPLLVARFRQTSVVVSSVVVWQFSLVASSSLHEVSFLTFFVVLRVVNIDQYREGLNRKHNLSERIRGICSSHPQPCMPSSSAYNANKDASRGHRYPKTSTNYTYVETTFSYVWACFMMKELWMISRDEKLGGGPNVMITSKSIMITSKYDGEHVDTTYSRYQWLLKVLNRVVETKQTKQGEVLKVLNRALEFEQIEQVKVTSCI